MKRMVIVVLVAGTVGVVHADQGKMREALSELRQAREQVDKASENGEGNRRKALQHIDNAISQVQKGIEFAGEKD